MSDPVADQEPEFEFVACEHNGPNCDASYAFIERVRVPGGWLYVTTIRASRGDCSQHAGGCDDVATVATTFVPEVAS